MSSMCPSSVLDQTLHTSHCHACSCFVLEPRSPLLNIKGHIVFRVDFLTTTLFVGIGP